MLAGLLTHTRGVCPVCGAQVARTHGFNGLYMSDTYACSACGDTTYAVAA